MLLRLSVLLLLSLNAALADGAPKTPFGGSITPADTQTWRCKSGRTVVSFSPNTQSIQLFYRGKVHRLILLGSKLDMSGLIQYANVGLADARQTGRELQWTINIRKPNSVELFQVMRKKYGQRQRMLLETCRLLHS